MWLACHSALDAPEAQPLPQCRLTCKRGLLRPLPESADKKWAHRQAATPKKVQKGPVKILTGLVDHFYMLRPQFVRPGFLSSTVCLHATGRAGPGKPSAWHAMHRVTPAPVSHSICQRWISITNCRELSATEHLTFALSKLRKLEPFSLPRCNPKWQLLNWK